ncbi:MAG: prolipoprotein diacylglyceryl transferase [Flavobacteriales bacterium]|nr:prolipoprotein diacylglyceryl transferase [Flavobacteriales bacterium]MCB9448954.1 prolipoprotein diacylglyceryl transferase [Flavobacteriales bacterium]
MYPSITDLLRDLLGINIPLPIQTFGFFVAVAFLIASWFLSKELKRMELLGWMKPTHTKVMVGLPVTTGELVGAGILGFLLGYKLIYAAFHYSQLVDDPQGIILSTTGSWLGGLAAAAFAVWMKKREKDKQKLAKPQEKTVTMQPHELVGTMTLWAAAGGIIGAKVFDILEDPSQFMIDPIHTLLSFSGLTFYGGLIVGAYAVIRFARKFNIPILRLTDAAAPPLMLAYGIGRIGCQMAGDGDWGITNPAPKPGWMSFLPDWMWSFTYPHNVINHGEPIAGCVGKYCSELPVPVYPTPFYECVMAIGLFIFLWSIRKRFTQPGVMFSLYLLVNGLERFFIEKIRVNNTYHIAGMDITQAEIISFCLILLGIAGLIYFKRNKHATHATS